MLSTHKDFDVKLITCSDQARRFSPTYTIPGCRHLSVESIVRIGSTFPVGSVGARSSVAMAKPFFSNPATDGEVEMELEEMTRNARAVQLETLRRILERSADSEYLLRHGMNGRTDEASFKACMPISKFADIEADIDRIANGDTAAILCADPISSFALSSGTSGGKSKMIPRTDSVVAQAMKAGKIGGVIRRRAFPRNREGKPVVMSFMYAGKQFETKSGLKVGTGTTNFIRGEAYKKNRQFFPFELATPDAVVLGYDVPQQMYCHLLCGLYRCQDVESMGAIFAYMVVEPFRLLEQAWRDICTDIRKGSVNDERVSDPKLRAGVQEYLSPNPDLADLIERECAKGWEGIIERLFPNMLYIQSIYSGAMLPYIAPLSHYAGNVPLMNADYGASESWIAINLDPTCPPENTSFTIIPDFAYFEFIPVHRESVGLEFSEDVNNIVGLTDVKIGQEYEIVLTTVAGLYRYRQEDILKVTGFYNETPQVSFVCRKGVVLSVNTDKTDEDELQMVVEKAAQTLEKASLDLTEFSSYGDLDSRPGHYVIFWELRSRSSAPEATTQVLDEMSHHVLEQCCKTLDLSFNHPYMRGRAAGIIGPLELAIVKEGSFARLMNQFVRDRGVGASQYKTPRCIVNPASLKMLREETVATFQSPEFPPELLAAWRPSTRITA